MAVEGICWVKFAAKYSLIGFEYDIVCEKGVFVDVQPSSVGRWFSFVTIDQSPLNKTTLRALLIRRLHVLQFDMALYFRQKFIVNSNITIWSSSDQNVFLTISHVLNIELEHFSVARPSEHL